MVVIYWALLLSYAGLVKLSLKVVTGKEHAATWDPNRMGGGVCFWQTQKTPQ